MEEISREEEPVLKDESDEKLEKQEDLGTTEIIIDKEISEVKSDYKMELSMENLESYAKEKEREAKEKYNIDTAKIEELKIQIFGSEEEYQKWRKTKFESLRLNEEDIKRWNWAQQLFLKEKEIDKRNKTALASLYQFREVFFDKRIGGIQ